ncbi:MAG: MMPL family transporter [Bacteroidales bacterium]
MWKVLAEIILKYRKSFITVIAIVTAFMVYEARKVTLDYNYVSLLPKTDPHYIDFANFRKTFGEDANLTVLGIQDPDFFKLEKFNDWRNLQDSLKKVPGIKQVLSISNAVNVYKNTELQKFEATNIFPKELKSQAELDSLANIFKQRPFYNGLVYNDSTNVLLMIITMDKDIINSKAREAMVDNIDKMAGSFAQKHGVKVHFSGLPYARTKISLLIRGELYMFIVLAMVVTALILYLFFRSFKVVLFSMLIVGIGVVWSVGTMGIFDYKITILTGMIPPLIIIIGIPNCVYLLNKYHNEYRKHGNKDRALFTMINRVGTATFLTNLTAAIGFGAFVVTGNRFLYEFGLVASINIMGLSVLSITLLPIFFSFLDPPKSRHIKHLDYKFVNGFVEKMIFLVTNKRKAVYIFVTITMIVSAFGIAKIRTRSFIIDDIPKNDPIYVDLKFLENNIGGVMPLEITIDTKKKKGVFQYTTLKKMDQLTQRLSAFSDMSKPTSVVDALKFTRQAYYNGSESAYKLPSQQELAFIFPYIPKRNENSNFNIIKSFVDSTEQVTRISYRINDIGTEKNKILLDSIHKITKEIFPETKYKVVITGSSVVFNQGTSFMVENLFSSVLLAIVLIAFFMAMMFVSLRMIIISLVPNFVPLLLTAAVMGYFGIPLKPSTILVFSISFGISVDNAIRVLAKYRQDLIIMGGKINESAVLALREIGISVIYTALILFFGFGIFTISKFGGTQSLGLLVSITLLVSMFSNMIFLPSLLLSIKHSVSGKAFNKPLIVFEEDSIQENEVNSNNQ